MPFDPVSDSAFETFERSLRLNHRDADIQTDMNPRARDVGAIGAVSSLARDAVTVTIQP